MPATHLSTTNYEQVAAAAELIEGQQAAVAAALEEVKGKEAAAALALASALEKEAQGNSLWLAREQALLDSQGNNPSGGGTKGKKGKQGKKGRKKGDFEELAAPEARREALREAKRIQVL